MIDNMVTYSGNFNDIVTYIYVTVIQYVGCIDDSGVFYAAGSISDDDPCRVCECVDYASGYELVCEVVGCPPTTCAYPVMLPGQCCAQCGKFPTTSTVCMSFHGTLHSAVFSYWSLFATPSLYTKDHIGNMLMFCVIIGLALLAKKACIHPSIIRPFIHPPNSASQSPTHPSFLAIH